MRCHTVAFASQHGIRFGRAVTGNNLERLGRSQLRPELPQQVQQPPIDLVNRSGPMIAEDRIDRGKRIRNVSAIGPIDRVQLFGRVKVIKG